MEHIQEKEYKGIVVEESLIDNRMLNDIQVIVCKISTEENAAERWHLNLVTISQEEIELLSKNLKDDHFFHCWKGEDVIVIFSDKKFYFKYKDKRAWNRAVKYGLSKGILKEEIDFPIEPINS